MGPQPAPIGPKPWSVADHCIPCFCLSMGLTPGRPQSWSTRGRGKENQRAPWAKLLQADCLTAALMRGGDGGLPGGFQEPGPWSSVSTPQGWSCTASLRAEQEQGTSARHPHPTFSGARRSKGSPAASGSPPLDGGSAAPRPGGHSLQPRARPASNGSEGPLGPDAWGLHGWSVEGTPGTNRPNIPVEEGRRSPGSKRAYCPQKYLADEECSAPALSMEAGARALSALQREHQELLRAITGSGASDAGPESGLALPASPAPHGPAAGPTSSPYSPNTKHLGQANQMSAVEQALLAAECHRPPIANGGRSGYGSQASTGGYPGVSAPPSNTVLRPGLHVALSASPSNTRYGALDASQSTQLTDSDTSVDEWPGHAEAGAAAYVPGPQPRRRFATQRPAGDGVSEALPAPDAPLPDLRDSAVVSDLPDPGSANIVLPVLPNWGLRAAGAQAPCANASRDLAMSGGHVCPRSAAMGPAASLGLEDSTMADLSITSDLDLSADEVASPQFPPSLPPTHPPTHSHPGVTPPSGCPRADGGTHPT